ncbi:putative transcription factor MADS-type1 family [Medicago truncatula]|nr:putative transcription factor MADS-type1 family [Medicago truncatula]
MSSASCIRVSKALSSESNLQVTFSKRRSGLFKKASKFCTRCRAYLALIIFSLGEKVFLFGQPSVETVINLYHSDSTLKQWHNAIH